jgi:hypothetical protein
MQSRNWRNYKKLFLRERSVSFLLKSRSKRNAERNTAEIEGEEDQKTFLRGCRTYITEIEGEEAQKSFLRGCKACVFHCGRVGVCLRHHHHFASYHHIILHSITSYIISHQWHENWIRSWFSANASSNWKSAKARSKFRDLSLRSMDIFLYEAWIFFFTKHEKKGRCFFVEGS